MKRFITMLSVLAAVCTAASFLGGTAEATVSPWLSYSEAVTAGIVPISDQYESQRDPVTCVPTFAWDCTTPDPLMYCNDDYGTWDGYSTAADLESAIASSGESNDCATDPRTVFYANPAYTDDPLRFYTNAPSTATSCVATGPYNQLQCWASQDSTLRFHSAGIRAGIESSAPSFTYTDPTTSARINATIWASPDNYHPSANCYHLSEVGWLYGIDQKNGDGKNHVYAGVNAGPGTNSGNCGAGTWTHGSITYYGYTPGAYKYVAYRILDNGYINGTQAWVYWAGAWRLLHNSGINTDFRCRSGSTPTCNISVGLEVIEGFDTFGTDVWPSMNAPDNGTGTNFKNIYKFNGSMSSSSWVSGDGAGITSNQPYKYCPINNYYEFRTPKATSC